MSLPIWVSLSDRPPDSQEYRRVLVYTEGAEFAGEQVFDVRTESLNPAMFPEGGRPEVCAAATHWMPRPAGLGVTKFQELAESHRDALRYRALRARMSVQDVAIIAMRNPNLVGWGDDMPERVDQFGKTIKHFQLEK